MTRLLCDECGWIGDCACVLKAKNPFEDGAIMACPNCKLVEDLKVACEINGCVEKASCGKSTANGYVRCCGDHYETLSA